MPADLPWGGMSAQEKAQQLATREKGKIPPIPDGVFCAAMNGALAGLDGAEDTIREVLAFHAAFIDPSADKNLLRKRLNGRSSKFASTELRARAARLTEACLVLLQGATGLRASEICGLDTSNEPAGGWPACVKIQKSISGLHELFVIAGRLYKTTRSWVDVEWIVGVRPVGSSHVPVPVRAASVLDRLYRPWRAPRSITGLFTLFIPGNALPTRVVAGRTDALTRAQKRHFETCGIESWEVTTHQWRKTFAQYVIRTDDRLLPALKDHFKHLSIAMTENGYINADPELRQLLDDARVQNTVNFIGDIVTGRRKAYGPLAEHFDKVSKDLGMRFGNRSDEERCADIKDLVATSDMRLYSLGAGRGVYGNCLFRPGTARCAEGCVAKWAMRAPLWTAAQPDICWECANLVPDDTHKAFWIERLQNMRAALAGAVADSNKALELLCRRREAQSLMVLALMGVAPEAINKETTDAA
jgi:integrase